MSAPFLISCLALFVALGGTSYAAGVARVARNSVGTAQLKSSAVTAGKIKAGNVTASRIAAGAVVSSRLGGNAVSGGKVADSSLTGADVADGSLGSADIANGSLNGGDLAKNSLNGEIIADNSLESRDLTADTVNQLTNVPWTWRRYESGTPSGTVRDNGDYDPFLTYATPIPEAGTMLVNAQVSISSGATSTVTCGIFVGDGAVAATTTNVAVIPANGRTTIPLMAVVENLTADKRVEVRCTRTGGDATVDIDPTTGATAMTLVRLAR